MGPGDENFNDTSACACVQNGATVYKKLLSLYEGNEMPVKLAIPVKCVCFFFVRAEQPFMEL